MKKAKLICICGVETTVNMIGNNNADGKALCECGRHITVHLRRYSSPPPRPHDGAGPHGEACPCNACYTGRIIAAI